MGVVPLWEKKSLFRTLRTDYNEPVKKKKNDARRGVVPLSWMNSGGVADTEKTIEGTY